MVYRYLLVVVLLIHFYSCSTTRKAAKSKDDSVMLDSIEIVASKDNPYRESAPRDFDLIHTKLEVRFDYAKQHLLGKATITLKPHFYPQQELTLDAKQFDINELSVVAPNNQRESLKYTYDSLQLKIKLNKTYTKDDQLIVFIDYVAKPEEREAGGSHAISSDKGLYFINPLGEDTTKPVQIWTQGETEANSCWFPTIDKPNQKTTTELYITHPKKYISLSNGTMESTTQINDSTVTDFWQMGLPHAPYLVMMAIGKFEVIQDHWRDVSVNYYMEPKYAPYAKQIFGNTPEMMEFFSQKLGFDYPWQKYSQVVVRDYVSGAMENTSATLHGEFIQQTPRELVDETYEDVISHELFHQWFGDLVTAESWSNLPLNESFATYGEYLWNEYKYGKDYADFKQRENLQKYLDESKGKNVDLVRFYYDDKEQMFDRHSYDKGGLLLNYLRKIVGDEAFFKSLELYLRTYQFKAAEVHQLRLAFEEVTGRDMNWFFNQWFYNAGHPVLDVTYKIDSSNVSITITQKHNIDSKLRYTLPMKIAVWKDGRCTIHDVVLKDDSAVFSFHTNGQADWVDIDHDRVVLCQKKENKTSEQYALQYMNSKGYMQRYEAVVGITKEQQKPEVREAMMDALKDPSYDIRSTVLKKIDTKKNYPDSLNAVAEAMARNDKSSWVRKAAIDFLAKAGDEKQSPLFTEMLNDSSYEVEAAALRALVKVDESAAREKAEKLVNEENGTVQLAVADVYARTGKEGDQDYFTAKLKSLKNYSKYSMYYYYANFITRMNKDVAISGINDILELGKGETEHYLTSAAKGALKRISKSFEEKVKELSESAKSDTSKSAVLEMEEKKSKYSQIIDAAEQALQQLEK